jgi:hypothetical protein
VRPGSANISDVNILTVRKYARVAEMPRAKNYRVSRVVKAYAPKNFTTSQQGQLFPDSCLHVIHIGQGGLDVLFTFQQFLAVAVDGFEYVLQLRL